MCDVVTCKKKAYSDSIRGLCYEHHKAYEQKLAHEYTHVLAAKAK